MKTKIYATRYCWVYFDVFEKDGQVSLSLWTSPDRHTVKPDVAPTPYKYQLTRNEVRYYVYSEVQLSQNVAIRIAGALYDAEFIIAPKLQMKQKVVNR